MSETKKPTVLLANLILVTIRSCLLIILLSVVMCFFDQSVNFIESITNKLAIEEVSRPYLAVLFVLEMISLFGIYNIWKRRRVGFYIFSISQLISIIYPIYQLKNNTISITNVIFTTTTLIIFAYYFFISKQDC